MKTQVVSCAVFTLAFLLSQSDALNAQPTPLPFLAPQEAAVKELPKPKEKEKDKKPPEKKEVEVTPPNVFTPLARSNMPSLYTPSMMGDWGVIYARQNAAVVGFQTTTTTTTLANGAPGTTTTTTTTGQAPQTRTVLVPNATRGGFNIAENESPIPRDRVFVFWNYYANVGFPQIGPNAPIANQTTTTQTTIVRNTIPPTVTTTTTTTTTVTPGSSRAPLNRETFGFEKTFLDGYASIELRAPLIQQGGGNAGFGADNFGDLTIIGKYALLLDRDTGNVFSTGLAVTVPSSRSIATTDGNIQDTIIQPFIGYIWNFDRVYLHAFHSIAVPTDRRDVTTAFNDVGLGYWLYRSPDSPLSFIAPTVEAHVTTPLNHRNFDGPIVVPDTVVITSGVNLGLFRNSTLALGVGVPVTGPRPYSIESFVYFNWRY